MGTPWSTLVKEIFDKNRASNKAYRLGDAMKDAKKVYRKTAKKVSTLVKSPFVKTRGRRRHRGRKTRGRRRRGGNDQHDQNDSHDQNQNQSSSWF